jgi:glycolate oxidase FAD binding subunit
MSGLNVQGVTPAEEIAPASIEEARGALERLARERRATVFVGGGTKLSLGAPPTRLDVVLRTGGLERIVEYAPSDQVVTVEAGITLGALQLRLARDRQRVSLDAPWPGRATLGGIIASNSFGPLRARSGSVRDLILGVTLVRADGVLARGGGRVVKNVAGFDLPKLMCGSLGTLALIAAVTVRVHPLPEATAVRVVRGLDAAGVVSLTARLLQQQLEPSALLARRSGTAAASAAKPTTWDVALRFEGFGPAVTQQVERLGASCTHTDDDEVSLFQLHQTAREEARIRLKIAALPNALVAVERALAPLEGELAWYPTLGLGFLTAAEASAPALEAARRELRALGGTLTVEEAPASLVPAFSNPAALSLHQAVKSRFDPDGLLAPGRFVGGI